MIDHGVQLVEQDGLLIMVSDRTRCTRCVLPDTFPDVDLRDGVCGVCRSWDNHDVLDDGQARFEELIRRPGRPTNHNVLLLYSGGKDSTIAMARLAADPSIRVLAMTMDNGFLPKKTIENISRAAEALDVDHVFVRPQAAGLQSAYREATLRPLGPSTIRYSTSACGVCISAVLAHARDMATTRKIPVLAGGWTPGQFTWDSYLPGTFIDQVIAENLSVMNARGVSLRGVIPEDGAPLSPPMFNTLACTPPTEAEIDSSLNRLGWIRPDDLDSCSSNCRLNSFLVVDHIRRHGFHPYAYELAHHVRIGLVERTDALEQLTRTGVSPDTIDRLQRQLLGNAN
jgi:hypothetical protein